MSHWQREFVLTKLIMNSKPTIVLVHGAFADANCWSHVIPLLESADYPLIAVQNALTSYSDDVATTKRVIDAQSGPVVVVGHSYGGAVITAAAADNPNVKALVYVAAFAPEAGEPIGAIFAKFGPSALLGALVPDAAGFVTIDRSKFNKVFAQDVDKGEAFVMAATQKPIIGSAFESAPEKAAWKDIPSWYLVSLQDRAIKPEAQQFYAERMGATTTEIEFSHVPFISHPQVVVDMITNAASA